MSLPPPTIDICNVDDVSFNESKTTMNKARIYRSYIPVIGSYAYGPWITYKSRKLKHKAISTARFR